MTQRMLAERDIQIDAENIAKRPSAWRDIYKKNALCWDTMSKSKWVLLAGPGQKEVLYTENHHLKCIVRLVEDGHVLNGHKDVPHEIQQQLYAKEQQRA